MTAITYVAQPNGYGCAIACCAMILGKTYEEMEAWYLARGCTRKRLEQGVWDGMYHQAMYEHGFSYVQLYKCQAISQTHRTPWPMAPFAPVHIVCTDVAAGSHAVVWLADGSVLDPYKRERTTLAHPDYRDVHGISGFYPRPA